MKKIVVAVLVLAAALTAAIAWKIRAQSDAESGPPAGSGVIENEGVDLSARLIARVRSVEVEEGAEVAEGDLLVLLECDEPEARLAEARARLASIRAQAQGAEAQAEAARRQSLAARASIGASGAQVDALSVQRDVASREAERVESMGEHAPLSRRDQVRTAATGLEAQVRAARASRAASQRQARAAESSASAAAAQALAVTEQIAAGEAMVQAAEIGVSECHITAPRAGIVERVYYDTGELVMAGAVIARVVDPSFVRATFYLPNADIDEARVGGRAEVAVDAIPEHTFEATVLRVGLEAEFTPRNIQTRTDRDRLVFPVEVRIANDDRRLRAGMPVTVTLPVGP